MIKKEKRTHARIQSRSKIQWHTIVLAREKREPNTQMETIKKRYFLITGKSINDNRSAKAKG